MKNLIFVCLAEREIDYYLETCKHLKDQCKSIRFISFCQPGNHKIEAAGYPLIDAFTDVPKGELDSFNVPEDLNTNLRKLCLHEKLTYGISDEDVLIKKFQGYYKKFSYHFANLEKELDDLVVVQELAGFLGPLAIFYICNAKGIPHYFIEPSFYQGRVHLIKNDLYSFFDPPKGSSISPEASSILDEVSQKKTIVVPDKDKHHFSKGGIGRLINVNNGRKLLSKIVNKYVSNEKQEFEHIGNHAKRAIRSQVNRIRVSGHYKTQIPEERFVYFPFHVPLDFQLTVRNPEYLDQLTLIEYISRILPETHRLVVKEHPAGIGGFDSSRVKTILEGNPSIVLMDASVNTYDILDKADAIVTINSKVGAEALVCGKTVFALGDGFYCRSQQVVYCKSLVELAEKLETFIRSGQPKPDETGVLEFFTAVYENSLPMKLYVNDSNNIKTSSESLLNAINS